MIKNPKKRNLFKLKWKYIYQNYLFTNMIIKNNYIAGKIKIGLSTKFYTVTIYSP